MIIEKEGILKKNTKRKTIMNLIKISCIFFVFVTISINNSFGQSINFSVKGGLNISNTKFSVIERGTTSNRDFDNRTSFFIGGGFDFSILSKNDLLLMQVELLYSRQGYTIFHPSLDYRLTFELDQVKLPVLLKNKLFNQLYLFGGGYIGHIINAQEDSSAGVKFKKDGYKNFDTGVIIGVEYHFNRGIFIESRYSYGLADVSSVEFPDSFIEHNYKNRLVQLGIGYKF